jgi:hypothetical protein
MFIEEPVLPENNEALREIANHTATPIHGNSRRVIDIHADSRNRSQTNISTARVGFIILVRVRMLSAVSFRISRRVAAIVFRTVTHII